jgi:hypothetical protein
MGNNEMNIKPYIPSGQSVIREGLIVLGGVLIAAWVLSRFPTLQKFVQSNSITVNNANGDNLF